MQHSNEGYGSSCILLDYDNSCVLLESMTSCVLLDDYNIVPETVKNDLSY
jgi:hypothetical protein